MKIKICKYCAYYTLYYTPRKDCDGKIINGFCLKLNKPQYKDKICKNFKSKEIIEIK